MSVVEGRMLAGDGDALPFARRDETHATRLDADQAPERDRAQEGHPRQPTQIRRYESGATAAQQPSPWHAKRHRPDPTDRP